MTIQFVPGRSYYARSICDHDCIYRMKVLGRTPKTIRVRCAHWDGSKTLRPYIYRDVEQVKPHGSYSMCAIISADREIPAEGVHPDWLPSDMAQAGAS